MKTTTNVDDSRTWQIEWKFREAKSTMELMTLMEKYKNTITDFHWTVILTNRYFSEKVVKKFEDIIPWNHIAILFQVSESLVEKHLDDIDIFEISAFYPLSLNFIKKHYHLLSIDQLVKNERLNKETLSYVARLYDKVKDNPSFHKRWDDNLAACKAFCPKNFTGRYTDYDGSTPFPIYKPLTLKNNVTQKQNIIAKSAPEKGKKVVDPNKYLGKTKQELKSILTARHVRVYYHDTLEILRQKCAESEE